MSVPRPIAPVPDPDLRATLDAFKQEAFAQLNCHQWGTVLVFDPAAQTVRVQIAVLRQVPDPGSVPPKYVARAYPELADVPIFFPQGATGALTMPIAAGDVCLVLFNDRDFDAFWETGTVALPNSPRLHDLSDGLALVGFRTKARPLADYDPDRVKLLLGATFLALGDKVELANEVSSLKAVVQKIIDAMTALNAKTGPSAAVQILAAQTEADSFLE